MWALCGDYSMALVNSLYMIHVLRTNLPVMLTGAHMALRACQMW